MLCPLSTDDIITKHNIGKTWQQVKDSALEIYGRTPKYDHFVNMGKDAHVNF